MKNFDYYFYLIILIKFFSANNKIYRIKFGLFNEKSSESNINNIFYNKIYLNLSIGTSPQIVPFELDNEVQTFCVTNNVYNENKSSTYEKITGNKIDIIYEVPKKGFILKDILNIDDNSNKKINFILGTDYPFPNKNQKFGIIGLRIPYIIQDGIFPFFHSLKDAELISSFSWTLKFFNNKSLHDLITYDKEKDNIIGEFIFGDEPSAYENDSYNFNEKGYYKINPSASKNIMNWRFNFSNIYLSIKEGENISKVDFLDDKDAQIIINYSFMSGPQYFLYFIEEHFFTEQYLEGVCEAKDIDFYTYIECDSTLKVETFPNITFEQRGFEYSFNLTYEDLFVFDEKSESYIFLIFIRDSSMIWELGTVFLRKFQFVYNEDLKTIGFYKYYNGEDKKDDWITPEEKISYTMKIVLIVVLSAIFAGLLIFIGMFLQKICNKDRKKRANELKDNFEYISENVDDNGLAINSDKKILKDEE